jgi:hypothetical protein
VFVLDKLFQPSLTNTISEQKYLTYSQKTFITLTPGANFTNILVPKRAAFAQIFFDPLIGNSIWQKCAEVWCLVKKLQLKICRNFFAQMLLKQNTIFCANYLMQAPLGFVQICW